MKKYYDLLIENEIMPLFWMYIDENGIAISEEQKYLQNIVENFVKIISISQFNYTPVIGATWNGSEFSKDLGFEELSDDIKDRERFGFIDKDNKFLGFFHYNPQTEFGAMMIAALSSNPLIILNRIDNDY